MSLFSFLFSSQAALALALIIAPTEIPSNSAGATTWELESRIEGPGATPFQTLAVSILRRVEDGWSSDAPPIGIRRVQAELFDTSTGRLIYGVQDDDIIPDYDEVMMEDPLGTIEIDRGRILLGTENMMSMGSWGATRDHYNFRFQDGCFRLIGHDRIEIDRSTASVVEVSANLLTGRISRTTDDLKTWGDLPESSPVCLGSMGGWYLPD